jgi:hypothetical protein
MKSLEAAGISIGPVGRSSDDFASRFSHPCRPQAQGDRARQCNRAANQRGPTGVLMIAGALLWLAIPVALVIGSRSEFDET